MAIAVFVAVAAAQGAPSYGAAAPGDREAYAERVEPVCEQGSETNDRILAGLRRRVKQDRLQAAGKQLLRAADAFEAMVERLVAVPAPPEDVARLRRWTGLLAQVGEHLRAAGAALKAENRTAANHRAIRAERSANMANNTVFSFGFQHCRLRGSRLA
jgi:hypothetical protein